MALARGTPPKRMNCREAMRTFGVGRDRIGRPPKRMNCREAMRTSAKTRLHRQGSAPKRMNCREAMRTIVANGSASSSDPQKNELPRGNEDDPQDRFTGEFPPQKNELPRGNEDVGRDRLFDPPASPQKNELPRGNEDCPFPRSWIVPHPPKRMNCREAMRTLRLRVQVPRATPKRMNCREAMRTVRSCRSARCQRRPPKE